MSFNIFVDGASGTTGLRIFERIKKRNDMSLLSLSDENRKDISARLDMVAKADLSILCLPDIASKEIAALAPEGAKICDTSTAHRTNEAWVYGFPEIKKREDIRNSSRVSIPGCHASGFISIVAPLVQGGIIPKDAFLSVNSLTGYSGGGKTMIQQYENEKTKKMFSPRMYGLTLSHKHLNEMQKICELENSVLFTPVVDDYYCGMLVSVPLFLPLLKNVSCAEQVREYLLEYYKDESLINVNPMNTLPEDGFMAANTFAGRDCMSLSVYSKADMVLITSLFDNLGKGSSGAALQCANIMLGIEETKGLVI